MTPFLKGKDTSLKIIRGTFSSSGTTDRLKTIPAEEQDSRGDTIVFTIHPSVSQRRRLSVV